MVKKKMFQIREQEELTQHTWQINRIAKHLLYLEHKRNNNPPVIDNLIGYWLDKLAHYQEKEQEALRALKVKKAIAEIEARKKADGSVGS